MWKKKWSKGGKIFALVGTKWECISTPEPKSQKIHWNCCNIRSSRETFSKATISQRQNHLRPENVWQVTLPKHKSKIAVIIWYWWYCNKYISQFMVFFFFFLNTLHFCSHTVHSVYCTTENFFRVVCNTGNIGLHKDTSGIGIRINLKVIGIVSNPKSLVSLITSQCAALTSQQLHQRPP